MFSLCSVIPLILHAHVASSSISRVELPLRTLGRLTVIVNLKSDSMQCHDWVVHIAALHCKVYHTILAILFNHGDTVPDDLGLQYWYIILQIHLVSSSHTVGTYGISECENKTCLCLVKSTIGYMKREVMNYCAITLLKPLGNATFVPSLWFRLILHTVWHALLNLQIETHVHLFHQKL